MGKGEGNAGALSLIHQRMESTLERVEQRVGAQACLAGARASRRL